MAKEQTSIEDRRRIAAEWCDFAVSCDGGRAVDDVVYQWVVEGRDPGPGYSSCGDLAHKILFLVGCREPFINRDEHLGFERGKNVNRLVYQPIGSNPYAEKVDAPGFEARRAFCRTLQRGDIVVTWSRPNTTDAHVLVFNSLDDDMVHSWDFGQGPMSADAWAGNRAHREARRRVRSVRYFPIRSVLRLDRVPFAAEPDLPSGERLDALELR